jgi:hypothetical protein
LADLLYAEIAPGQGEVLASGVQGSPWRMLVDRTSGEVHTVAFANFSQSMLVREGRLENEASRLAPLQKYICVIYYNHYLF